MSKKKATKRHSVAAEKQRLAKAAMRAREAAQRQDEAIAEWAANDAAKAARQQNDQALRAGAAEQADAYAAALGFDSLEAYLAAKAAQEARPLVADQRAPEGSINLAVGSEGSPLAWLGTLGAGEGPRRGEN